MSDEERADTPDPDTAGLAEVAERVSGDAQMIANQLAGIRAELAEARTQADADIAAAKKQSALDVAAERRDRRRASWKFALVVIVDVVLSAVSLGLYVDQRDTEAKLHETQVAVLCPLYKLFAQAIQLPRVGETDQQRAVRLAAAKPISDGYTKLGCQPPLKSG